MCDYNLNAILCKKYDENKIEGIFDKINLKNINESVNFKLVLLLNIIGDIENNSDIKLKDEDINKTMCVYLYTEDENYINSYNLANIEVLKDNNKLSLIKHNEYKSIIPSINCNYILGIEDFKFPEAGNYNIIVFMLDNENYNKIETENKFLTLISSYKKNIKFTTSIKVEIID